MLVLPAFNDAKRGYNQREVDEYIDGMLSGYNDISNMCAQLQAKVQKLEDLLINQENVLKEIMTTVYSIDRKSEKAGANDGQQIYSDVLHKTDHQKDTAEEEVAEQGTYEYSTEETGEQHTNESLVPPDNKNDDNRVNNMLTVSEFDKLDVILTDVRKQKSLKKSARHHRKVFLIAGNVLFYGLLVAVLIAGLFYGTVNAGSGGGRTVFGYYIFKVLTSSMQSELPKGSLILCKPTDTGTIETGDDITFFVDKDTTVTHRVIAIYENYENSGQRGFETKGIENPHPDDDIVYADNVLGKVVWHIPNVDSTIGYFRKNWLIMLLLFLGLIGLGITLKILFSKDEDDSLREEITESELPAKSDLQQQENQSA